MKRNDVLAYVGWRPFLSIAIISFALNLLQLNGPLYMMQVYDRVIASGSISTLVGLSVIVGIAYVFMMVLDWLRARAGHKVGAIVDAVLSPACYHLNINLPRLGPKTELNPVSDLDRIRHFASGPGLIALFDVPWIPIHFIILYFLHPLLALVTVIGSLVLLGIMGLNALLTTGRLADLTAIAQHRSFAAESGRHNYESIAGMGMETALIEHWDRINSRHSQAHSQINDISSVLTSSSRIGRLALQSTILGIGAYLVVVGEMSAGAIIASSILSARALSPIDQVVAQWPNLVNARAAFRRLERAFAVVREREIKTLPPAPYQTLHVNQLVSGPVGQRKVIVRDVSFNLNAGEALAIVGPSGSGKSTIVRAICGVWPIFAGGVRLDGVQLDHWSSRHRSQFVGYLPQSVQLLPGTIAQNIARFQADATSDEVIAAAESANVHDLICSLPEGYDTYIEDAGGAGLSAGQLQRVGLARAFFRDPFLIVLDEPNSNLDSFGEQALTAAIANARARGAVLVIVTHRAKILSVVDKIMVVQNGSVQRYGSARDVAQHLAASPAPARPNEPMELERAEGDGGDLKRITGS